MDLVIVSPSKVIFEGEVEMVIAPGELGELGILRAHTPLISNLKEGILRVKSGGNEEQYKINGGFLEVLKDKVVVTIYG
ncbi:TPA: ATP synthase F1 subunit epsilon [bacterium]|nr:ATP synthase F1 subunit epsilon [bacterium]